MIVIFEFVLSCVVLVLSIVSVVVWLCMLFDVFMLSVGLIVWCISVMLVSVVLLWLNLVDVFMNVMLRLWYILYMCIFLLLVSNFVLRIILSGIVLYV